MAKSNGNWVKAATLDEVEPGESKAVRAGEGCSIALFNLDGTIRATDNQCPHMGYPLTRGRVRNGIVTCDWHARSFDLEGGGCFNVECDDLVVFPVEIRGKEIWVQVPDGTYRRQEEHLRLLYEGLLSNDLKSPGNVAGRRRQGRPDRATRPAPPGAPHCQLTRGRWKRGCVVPRERAESRAPVRGRRPSDCAGDRGALLGRGCGPAPGGGAVADAGGVGSNRCVDARVHA